jgi:hypothetical protein
MNEVLEYIKQHVEELIEEFNDESDPNYQTDYLQGCIESLEHVLAKFGAE